MFHGLLVLKSCLSQHGRSDLSLCYQILKILGTLPISSRNTIVDNKMDDAVSKMVGEVREAEIAQTAKELLETWAALPLIYKIPKRLKSVNEVSRFICLYLT